MTVCKFYIDKHCADEYNNSKDIFRAGCDSPPAVKSANTIKVPKRCNSVTDGIVRMKEEKYY